MPHIGKIQIDLYPFSPFSFAGLDSTILLTGSLRMEASSSCIPKYLSASFKNSFTSEAGPACASIFRSNTEIGSLSSACSFHFESKPLPFPLLVDGRMKNSFSPTCLACFVKSSAANFPRGQPLQLTIRFILSIQISEKLASSQAAISSFAEALPNLCPFSHFVESEHNPRKLSALEPMPLLCEVQNGRIVFPEKS